MRHHIIATAAAALLVVLVNEASGESYEYDAAGRLTRVQYDDGSVIEYSYDAAGNLVERTSGEDADSDGVLYADGQNICTGAGADDCEDNCRHRANPDQSDVGSVGAAGPDGVGDVCQCADVTGSGIVDAADPLAVRQALARVAVLANPDKCNAIGTIDSGDADGNGVRDDCNIRDVAVIVRALAGREPPIGQVCAAAVGGA